MTISKRVVNKSPELDFLIIFRYFLEMENKSPHDQQRANLKLAGKIVGGMFLGFIGFIILIVVLFSGVDEPKAAEQPKPQAAPQEPKVVLELAGTGTKQTEKFTVNSEWKLEWSYDCSKYEFDNNFIVDIKSPDGSRNTNSPINQIGKTGQDVQSYYDPGTYFLSVTSMCDWKVTVKG